MFDSHDDDLWEVPSIDADVPEQAAVPTGVAVPAAEAETARPLKLPRPPRVNPRPMAMTRPWPRTPRATATTWMGWTANCSSTLLARSCART